MKPIRKATIDDVAKLAGVSIKTVSRVTNKEPNVREATRVRVEAAIEKLKYRPNISARNLASHRSHYIVLVYEDPSIYENPSSGYIVRLQQGALNACRVSNCELLIHPCNYHQEAVISDLKSMIDSVKPDGIILAAPLSNMANIVDAINNSGTPFVRVSPGEKVKERSVGTNDREISAEMTRYLASLGHEKIAFITGDPKHKAVANRFSGYKDGLEQSGLAFDQQFVVAGDNSIGSGQACTIELLGRDDPPTAIFAANDDMAAGVIRQADKMGVKVPEQLSVAGCDDNSLASQIYPALTTIRQPLAKMSESAALSLIGESGHNGNDGKDSKPDTDIVPGSLQIRDSTGPAPGR